MEALNVSRLQIREPRFATVLDDTLNETIVILARAMPDLVVRRAPVGAVAMRQSRQGPIKALVFALYVLNRWRSGLCGSGMFW
jgi:hypothetical protein